MQQSPNRPHAAPRCWAAPTAPHPIFAPVEDAHSTAAALGEHPQQSPKARPHFPHPLCHGMWDSSGTPGPATGSGCAPPPVQGLQQPEDGVGFLTQRISTPCGAREGQRSQIPCPEWDPCSTDQSERLSQQRPPQKHSCAPSTHWHKALPHTCTPHTCTPHLPSSNTFTCRSWDMAQQDRGLSSTASTCTQRCSASCPHSTAGRRGAQRPSQMG